MKRMQWLAYFGMLAIVLALTAGPGRSDAADPIKIGASLPLTGPFAIAGQKHRDGYQFCVDSINKAGGMLGRQVDLIVSDNRSDTETAISQVERFINQDKVDLLFGTFSSKLSFPVSSVAEKAGFVYPIPSGGALRIYERGYKHIFYFQVNAAEFIGDSPVNAIRETVAAGDRPKTAAVVYADDFFSNAIAAGLLGKDVKIPGTSKVIKLAPGSLAKAGIEVVYTEKWPEEGFSDWLTLANSIKSHGAELLVGLAASPDDAVHLVRALRTVQYQPKAVYLSQGTQEEFKEAVGSAANGIIIHASWHPAAKWVGELAGKPYSNQDFQNGFRAAFNRAADEDEAIPFALCQGIEQAVLGTKSTDNAKISAWLHARDTAHPVRTILGTFQWDARGLPKDKFYLLTQWQNGDLRFIYPPNEFPDTAKMIWPKPGW